MISQKFKWILLAAVFCYFIMIYYYLKRQRLLLKYTLIWILVGLALTVLVIYPPIMPWATKLLGMYSDSNLLFLIMIALTLILVMSLTAIVSGLSCANRKLAQQIALLEQRLELTEKRETKTEATIQEENP